MTEEILLILLSWASYFSGYPVGELPEVRYEPHSFFVENVCGGKECRVVGWYDDNDIVYIDEKHENDDGVFVSSLIVHEFTHHMQHKSEEFNSLSCEDSVKREHEAYYVQNRYIIEAMASFQVVFPAPIYCNY